MKTSSETDKIFPAYIAAQKEMGNLKKDAENPFYKSSYSSLEMVLQSIKPVFLAHGIAIIQGSGLEGQGINVITRLIHESGQWIETAFPVPLSRNDPQAAGSASSYGRRYALKAIASLAEMDDDAQSSSDPPAGHDRSGDSMKAITPGQLKEVTKLFETLKVDPDDIKATCAKFSADRTQSPEALMKSEAARLIPKLRDKLKEKSTV